MEKKVIIYTIILVLILVASFFLPDSSSGNKIVTLAIAESESIHMSVNDRIDINVENENYFLTLSSVRWDRKGANFILMSDPNSEAPYLRQYFKLYPQGKTSSMFRDAEIYYVYPGKSETIKLESGKEIYIELVSIRNRGTDLIIKLQ